MGTGRPRPPPPGGGGEPRPRARRIAFWAVLALMVGLQVLWVRTIWLFNPHGDWPP